MRLDMRGMSPEQARIWLDRWKEVESTQLQLQHKDSLEVRLQQLSVLMASRDLFPPDPDREAEVAQVRERWRRLREALG